MQQVSPVTMNEFDSILDPTEFCRKAIAFLENSTRFAEDYVALRLRFFNRFQKGVIFSTRFGSDFFTELFYHLETGDMLSPEPGKKLGEYDESFNRWLKGMILATHEGAKL